MGIHWNEEEIQGWNRSLPELEQSWAGAPPWLSWWEFQGRAFRLVSAHTWAVWRHLLEKREDSNCSPWMLNLIRWRGEQETAASSTNPAFESRDSRWPHWRESPLWQSQGNSGTPMTLRSHTHRILRGVAGNMSKPCTVGKMCPETEVTWACMSGERP